MCIGLNWIVFEGEISIKEKKMDYIVNYRKFRTINSTFLPHLPLGAIYRQVRLI